MSKEEKNLALMPMKKKDKRLYDRIMHSKKKKRSEVSWLVSRFFAAIKQLKANYLLVTATGTTQSIFWGGYRK